MNKINKSAFIGPKVKLGAGNFISENVVIDGNVTIGDNNYFGPNCLITNNVIIGNNNTFTGFASVGLEGEMGTKGDQLFIDKYVIIGNQNKVREFVTIHSPVRNKETRIGDNCYLMSRSHIAHDCLLKNRVILATNAILGGGTTVDDIAYIGLSSVTHQWLSIGKGAMVGMNAVNTRSVVPFTTVVGAPSKVLSFNIVGAQRNGYQKEALALEKLSIEEVLNSKTIIDDSNEILKAIHSFCQENPNSNTKLR